MKKQKNQGLALSRKLSAQELARVSAGGLATSPALSWGVITSPDNLDGIVTTPNLNGLGSSPV